MFIEHIAMYVEDLYSERDFFVKYLNAVSNREYHNPKTGFRSFFLSFDNGARLEIMNRPNVDNMKKEPIRSGLIHIAFSVGGKDKVDALTERLKNDGYKVISDPRTTGDGYYESCIEDPEGNIIEITV